MNPRVPAVSLLLFGSGLCALVYQTVWLREFRLIFGASTAATAAVLGIFMGGLGLGSMLLGKRCEKARRPLAFYACLELIIALSAAATPFLVTFVRHIYSMCGGSLALGEVLGTGLRLALSAVVLAVPTFLMGGTLPSAARSVIGKDDTGRRGLACLYGINTLGGVTGALLATFLVLEVLGNRMTLWSACLVNFGVALIALVLSRSMPESQPTQPDAAETEAAANPAAPASFVLFAAAVVGFAFLLMELVWYRMLSPLLGGSTFTFGLILGVALLGIGIGGALYAIAGQRRGGTLPAFAWTCALEAVAIAAPFALGDRLAVLAAYLRNLSGAGFEAHVFGWFIVIAIVVLPAAIVAGYQFPLLVALLGRGDRGVASHIARAYALNTAGAIAGSLAGGFGLLPILTATGVWKLVAFTLAALSLIALIVQQRREKLSIGPAIGVLGTVGVATVMLLAMGPTAAWRHSGVGAGRSEIDAPTRNGLREKLTQYRQRIVWEGEGVESSVAIHVSSAAAFVVNGKTDGNIRGDAGTQVLGGLIGAALLPEVRSACVIGLGTGCTAGWLGRVPEMERVDVMELEPAIVEMARVCSLANQNVLENPKCHLLFGDARELLITTRSRYDLIFSEPSNPYRAGIASLFTTEFYETARARLNPGGLFLQWVQAYEVESDAIRMVLATLGNVFPHVEVWVTQVGDLLLVASPEARTTTVDQLRKRLETEPFRTATRRIWGIDSAEGFLAHFAAAPELARRLAAMPSIDHNTDDNTRLEFAFARSVGRSGGFKTPELFRAAEEVGASRPPIVGEVDWARVEEERLAMWTYGGYPPPLPASLPDAAKARCLIRQLVLQSEHAGAARIWLEKRPEPLNPRDVLSFAKALAEVGSPEAVQFIDKLRAEQPGEAAAVEATLAMRQKRIGDAATSLLAAYAAFRTDAWPLTPVQLASLELAAEIGIADPKEAAALFAALDAGPLPGYLMEAARRETLVRLTLTRWQNGEKVGGSALARLEPWPTWTRESLKNRYAFYRATGLGDAAQARRDLETFFAADVAPFNRGLVVPPPAANR